MTAAEQLVEDFKRNKLAELVAQCTPKQQECYRKIWPAERFPNGCPSKDLISAMDLCLRTLAGGRAMIPVSADAPEGEA